MTDRQGQTALFLATELGRAEVIRYLLDHGARTDAADDMGRKPADMAKRK
jgi:ankyrin repeat protein